jgi:hypothetical protein
MAAEQGLNESIRRAKQSEQEMDRQVHHLEEKRKELEEASTGPVHMPTSENVPEEGPHLPGLG